MPDIDLTIGGRPRRIGCAEGDEIRLRALAEIVDAHATALSAQPTVYSDAQLFLMAALMVADDLAEAKDRIARLESGAAYESAQVTAPPTPNAALTPAAQTPSSARTSDDAGASPRIPPELWLDPEIETAFREIMDRAASRLDRIADRIDAA